MKNHFMSRAGFCSDFSKTPFVLAGQTIENENYALHFSNEKYLNQFVELGKRKSLLLAGQLANLIHIPVIDTNFLLFSAYAKIEKRGFYVVFEGEVFTCLRDLLSTIPLTLALPD